MESQIYAKDLLIYQQRKIIISIWYCIVYFTVLFLSPKDLKSDS